MGTPSRPSPRPTPRSGRPPRGPSRARARSRLRSRSRSRASPAEAGGVRTPVVRSVRGDEATVARRPPEEPTRGTRPEGRARPSRPAAVRGAGVPAPDPDASAGFRAIRHRRERRSPGEAVRTRASRRPRGCRGAVAPRAAPRGWDREEHHAEAWPADDGSGVPSPGAAGVAGRLKRSRRERCASTRGRGAFRAPRAHRTPPPRGTPGR